MRLLPILLLPQGEDRFKLNVGGVRYDTSRTTLTKVPESMLATMFGARVDMLQSDPEDGSVTCRSAGTIGFQRFQ